MSLEAGARLASGGSPPGASGSAGFRGLIRRWRDDLVEPVLSVLFPPRCVGCGDFESHLCPACEASLVPIGPGCCLRCGQPGPRPLVGRRCSHCMGEELAFAGARSAFVHTGAAKRMVLEFKLGGQPVLASLMARLAGPAFRELVAAAEEEGAASAGGAAASAYRPRAAQSAASPAARPHPLPVVTWVPSHRAAERERGYNQAALFARALAAAFPPRPGFPPLPAVALARKPVRTRHQKELGKAGRRSNLRGAFSLDGEALGALPSRPGALVLVDDVYTTGATAQELSSVLATGTGLPVYVFTFSRAVSNSGEGHD